jgi:protein SCO1
MRQLRPRRAFHMEGVARFAGLVGLAALVASACGTPAPGAPPGALGVTGSRPVPASIAHLPLTDQHGRALELSSFTGKTVMVGPFLTLCTDVCPLDTGNLLQVQHALSESGMALRVQLVELSIDPARDTPARLAAYARLTGASWELVTESSGVASQFERFFGWVVQRVPEDDPPSIDWWTGQPLTYDVNHSDGFVVIDARGTERFSTGAPPDFRGNLNPTLHRFLTDEGRQHLAHPQTPGWNPAQALQVLAWVLATPIAGAAS